MIGVEGLPLGPVLWVMNYLGLPYANDGRDPVNGIDCWGLVVLVYREVFGIEVPAYLNAFAGGQDYRALDTAERDEVAALADGARCNWIQVTDARLGDVIDLSWTLRRPHCGIVVSRRHMLHASPPASKCEDFTGLTWTRRLKGCYRHPSLVG